MKMYVEQEFLPMLKRLVHREHPEETLGATMLTTPLPDHWCIKMHPGSCNRDIHAILGSTYRITGLFCGESNADGWISLTLTLNNNVTGDPRRQEAEVTPL